MALHLKNGWIDNCGTGISAPNDAQIHADGLSITNTHRAIELRDPPGLLQQLGLPADTPPLYLIEALKLLDSSHTLPQEQRMERLRESRLIKFLSITADLTSITSLGNTLLSFLAQGL